MNRAKSRLAQPVWLPLICYHGGPCLETLVVTSLKHSGQDSSDWLCPQDILTASPCFSSVV
jgi:hypothetical protein